MAALLYYVKSELMNRTLFMLIRSLYEKTMVSSIIKNSTSKGYSLDKKQTSYDDLLDGLRLSLCGYNIK